MDWLLTATQNRSHYTHQMHHGNDHNGSHTQARADIQMCCFGSEQQRAFGVGFLNICQWMKQTAGATGKLSFQLLRRSSVLLEQIKGQNHVKTTLSHRGTCCFGPSLFSRSSWACLVTTGKQHIRRCCRLLHFSKCFYVSGSFIYFMKRTKYTTRGSKAMLLWYPCVYIYILNLKT